MDVYEESSELHERMKGKLAISSKVKINTKEDLSLAYTPGVAEPCRRIAKKPEDIYKYTNKGNLVAVVSDGSAVLGLGNIGGKASMPVMEGKAILFKEFADVDAFPICLDTQDDEEIIRTVKLVAPTFGGINLEDIAAPRCFYIERRLIEELDIPVFHDDQHGTAICVLAGIMNSSKVVGKDIKDLTVVINGVGAAGSAIGRILIDAGVKDVRLVDRNGIINKNVKDTMLNWNHEELAGITNKENRTGNLVEAVKGADVFVGVSKPGLLTQDMVRSMADKSIIFAMANPQPEILPEEAKRAGAAIIGTGRSDFPNQVNNVLVFPGLFRGVLKARVKVITKEMKFAAAKALAGYIPENKLNAENILPSALDKNVAKAVAIAVCEAAK
ncbi:MAG: NADP-dependent malic enzyme [Lachnospiraceae bacterium]|jgi:malate dehydrogenase (oxaloacetate-decarboxylating)|nr:NADP-dependent malic enzyme [Lachnospiraceae bacterium]